MNIDHLFHKHNLDTLERKILKYIYDNISDVKNIGIRKVAADNFTSTSMIYKLAKKLGFDGYSDMIHYIHYSYNDMNFSTTYKYNDLYNLVSTYKDDFNSLLNEYKNKRIVITGMGFSDIISKFITQSLFLKGFNTSATIHMELLSSVYKDEILIIAISESGETTRLVEVISEAQKNNFKIISFTGNINSSLATLSNLSIPIGEFDKFKKVSSNINTFFGELLLCFEYLLSN